MNERGNETDGRSRTEPMANCLPQQLDDQFKNSTAFEGASSSQLVPYGRLSVGHPRLPSHLSPWPQRTAVAARYQPSAASGIPYNPHRR